MDDRQIWTLEERLWLEGSGIYDALLDPACLMAFPGMGVMRAADVLDSLKSAPRWASVVMSDRTVGWAGDNVLVLGYAAEGRRDGVAPYRCFCTPTCRRDGGGWRLVQHQQTMAG